MRLYFIRHAHAGSRRADGRDLYRPLSEQGRERALAIADLLAHVGVERVLSSPASRCVQTVEPLAARLGLDVIEQPDLWEGSATAHVLALLDQQRKHDAVVACSHGDVIPETIEMLSRTGTAVTGRGCAKGSIWQLDHDGERWATAQYLRASSHSPD